MNIDWDVLRNEALTAMKKAYVPYSKFPVGVAALVDDGRIVTGATLKMLVTDLPCALNAD